MIHIHIPTALFVATIPPIIISEMPVGAKIALIAISVVLYILTLSVASGYGVGEKCLRPLTKSGLLVLAVAGIIVPIVVGCWVCAIPFGVTLIWALLTQFITGWD